MLLQRDNLDLVIELRQTSMKFKTQVLLQNINLQIHRGETFVLIGPSGHGKTVLLKLMAGILRATSGEVLIKGKNLSETDDAEREKILHSMGMLFQQNALFDSLTVSENIAFPLREVTNLSNSEIEARVDSYLEAVGLSHAKKLFPDEISGGMQKRLGIARALALDPEILFYDDPTAGLDPITSKKIADLILGLKKKRNATVVAITNDMNRAYQMADRIAMLIQGELIVTGSVSETKTHSDPRVRQFMQGLLEGPLKVGT